MSIKVGLENIVKGEMKGLQFGLKNVAKKLSGVQVGGWNETKIDSYRPNKGLQLSYFINGSNILYGAQMSVLFNICQEMKGMQASLFNIIDDHGRGKAKGVQFGAMNGSDNMEGVQIGLGNISDYRMKGVQFGICNEANEGNYLQIGLWNRKKGDSWYKGVPFLRYRKEG
ncbi:hypothetical protein GF361_01245 [Candidatus Woesearchaeota archaeon]|nr:hypothetical protein [Candidatus Woesearchaeota archaeon]